MKKRILSAVLVSGVTLSAAASVHAEDYDSQIAAADNAISNLASQQETAQAQVATIQSQVSTLRTQKSELETKNAELEKVSADLESEIQELSSKIVARQDSLAKQARSAQQNNTATSYINSILNSKSISEAITRITAISKVVTANNDMLTKQESDQKELAAKQEQNQAAINEIATNKAELEAAQVALAAELATAQDEKTSLVSAKSTAEAVAASTAASVAQSQAIAESEAAAQAVASSEAAAFVAQSEAAATSEAVAQPSEATVSEIATASEAVQEPVSSETSETTQEPTVATSEATQEPEAQPESAAPAASEAPAPASEAPAATSEAPASQAPAASEAPAPAAETPKVSATSTPNTYPVGQCTWGAKSLASWVGNYWGNAKNWIASAQAAGHSVGTTPVAGAIAVWPNDGGGYGHVAYVTSASGANSIQVMESNYAGNMSIGNYRGTFDPTSSAHGGSVYYIYP